MEIQNLPKHSEPLPEKEKPIFENLFPIYSKEFYNDPKKPDEKSSESKVVVKEVIKFFLLLTFSTNKFIEMLQKMTGFKNNTLYWIIRSLVLLLILYVIDNKI